MHPAGAIVLVMAAIALAEALLRPRYDWRAGAASLADAAGRRLLDALGVASLAPVVGWVWEHRVATVPLTSAWAIGALFVAEELLYYAYHRAAHRVRWFWATHAVHHSPNELTLATALRLGWTGRYSGATLFFLPLVALGFAPAAVGAAVALNLFYQFWLHATWIPRLGPLERVLNTPSHHRVHHGSNPEYLDCNYGGIVIVFDRLFGTFVEERADVPPRYGLAHPITSHNPIVFNFREWALLLRDLVRARGARARIRTLLGPP